MTTVLVTGATGTIGSGVTSRLAAAGTEVRAFARDAGKARRLLGADIDVAVGDFADPAALAAAVEGVDALFLACANVPAQVDNECAVIDAAARAGVPRIVKLSARGAAIGAQAAYWHWHAQIERHLAASNISAVVLRPGFLMTNLLAAADQVRGHGALFAPASGARIAMIDPRDVAAAAAAALLTEEHDSRTFTLTGPAAIDYQQVVQELAAAIGHPVQFVDILPPAARSALIGAGLPPFAAEQVVTVFDALRRGEQSTTTDAVRTLTGHQARPFAAFARDHAAAFGVSALPVIA